MPEADIDRIYDYDPAYIAGILKSVKSIAMVGASPDKTKFSYGVLRVLNETGYDMIPVNPRPEVTEIRGIKVYHSLREIDRPVDMVEVFRPKLAEDAGLKVVMNRCPKIELFRPFWKPRLDLAI